MLIVSETEGYRAPCALLLGGFDGLHRGHAALLAAAKATGLPVGMTSILGGKAGGELFTGRERRYLFEEAGVTFVAEYPFSERFRTTSPGDFLRGLFARAAWRARCSAGRISGSGRTPPARPRF